MLSKLNRLSTVNQQIASISNNNLCYRCCSRRILDVNEEVSVALKENKPVVALESTIITHGMPFPKNIECAQEVEAEIRQQGAVPATIAIIEGRIKVGLDKYQIQKLGDINSSKPIKTSRRDLAYVVSKKLNGGTTVCGTLIIANKIGISIFATGGIGGVHREGEVTFDISADLTELGRSNVAVVSSGVKSILDIGKTLEYLETQGVLVSSFGNSPEFPAFYTRSSGFKAPYYVRNAKEAAEIIAVNKKLNLKSGMLFAVPIPEEHSMEERVINDVIEKALVEARTGGVITGKQTTPYLLSKIAEITEGRSLQSNIALIKNNARTAADIAVELSRMESFGTGPSPRSSVSSSLGADSNEKNDELSYNRPVLIGGTNLDCHAKLQSSELKVVCWEKRRMLIAMDVKTGGWVLYWSQAVVRRH